MQYISITKLTIQFLQLLGEGFNIDYHNNIFKLQEEVIVNNEQEDEEDYEGYDEEYHDQEAKFSLSHYQISSIENKLSKYITNTNALKSDTHLLLYINETIYDSIILYLKSSFYLLDITQQINCEMPYDKLIVLTTNLVDFLIEYIDTKPELRDFIVTAMKFLFFGSRLSSKDSVFTKIEKKGLLKDSIFSRIPTSHADRFNYQLRKKIISYVKMKYVQLLIAYLQTDKRDEMIFSLIKYQCSPVELFSEILFNFKQMIVALERHRPHLYNKLTKKQSNDSFINQLIEIYV